mmetsp:Transcript_44459/g.115591  ORF Transcript_44459/g.115591 Transcript_44459/m.115591 type:complete len:584 (+) Transcript_44459:213-1964(+)
MFHPAPQEEFVKSTDLATAEADHGILTESLEELLSAEGVLHQVKANLEVAAEVVQCRLPASRSVQGGHKNSLLELRRVHEKISEVNEQLLQVHNEAERVREEISRKEIEVLTLRSGYEEETIKVAVESEMLSNACGGIVAISELQTFVKVCFVRIRSSLSKAAFSQWKYFTQRERCKHKMERFAIGRVHKLKLGHAVSYWRKKAHHYRKIRKCFTATSFAIIARSSKRKETLLKDVCLTEIASSSKRERCKHKMERFAIGRVHKLKLGHAVSYWRKKAHHYRKIRKCFTATSFAIIARRLSTALTKWLDACQRSFRIKHLLRNNLNILLTRTIERWKGQVFQSQSIKSFAVSVEFNTLCRFISKWKSEVAKRQKRCRLEEQSRSVLVNIKLYNTMRAWYSIARKRKMFQRAVLEEAAEQLDERILVKAWRCLVFQTVFFEKVASAVDTMKSKCSSIRTRRIVESKLKLAFRNWKRKKYFELWRVYVDDSCMERRALVYFFGRCLARSWLGWKKLSTESRLGTKLLYKALLFFRRNLQSRVFHAWSSWMVLRTLTKPRGKSVGKSRELNRRNQDTSFKSRCLRN